MGSCYHPDLKKLTNDDVERFTLKGTERYAKVLSVYDGDTCDLVFYEDEEMENHVRYKCRMSGYDAPELGDESGELARDYLAHLCMGGNPAKSAEFLHPDYDTWTKEELQEKLDSSKRLVHAEFGREGKYGRLLVTLYQTSSRGNPPQVADTSINDLMKQFINELD